MKQLIKRQMFVLIMVLFFGIDAFGQKTPITFEGKTLTELADQRRTKPLTEHTGEEHLILFLEREILRQFDKGNMDKAMSYLAEDAMVNPPGMEAIFGRAEQKQMFNALLAQKGVEFVWEPIEATVSEDGTMAYAYGLAIWKMPNEKRKLGKYIAIWIKQDGEWMNQVEIRNLIKEEE